jgi:hypothetical protein
MGTVLTFATQDQADPRRTRRKRKQRCEIVIFPGVRIERHDLDLSHRPRDAAGQDEFDGLGGNDRPRKTS